MKRLSVVLILLAMVSVANADMILTLNSVDAAKKPLEIAGKDNFVITIAGQSRTTESPFYNSAEPEKSYLASMSAGGTSGIDSFPEPNFYPDINSDNIVNFVDFAIFAENWQKSGDGLDGDFDDSGAVDTNDLATLAYFWLNGPHPLDVFESFKAALSVGDVNEALTFVTEISREKYAEIFQIIEPNLPDYVAGMGEMIFDRHRFGEVKYEMLHQDGELTLSFPVFFIRDENGDWKIFNL